ncbi:DMT family transporter [Kiloniella sp. EL199]|uniref:DMT family transporter n=1 Tax=Kiloniella sp. EL199 TaxID=2107581 RepID=UPI000EA0193F|nr:DMT family transporter [Kiloniella sp. EL199]
MNNAQTKKPPLAGIVTGLAGGTAFGLITPVFPFAHSLGVTASSATIIRFIIGSLIMAAIILVTKSTLTVPKNKILPLCSMGLLIFGVTVCYLSAVTYIPVSLGAILFYTYPVIVTVIDPLLQRRLPSLIQLGLSILAFTGITIALGTNIEELDWRGVLFVMGAAFSISGTLIVSRSVVSHVPNLTIVFYVNIVATALTCLYLLFDGNVSLPNEWSNQWFGWVLSITIALLYLLATLGQIATVNFIGPSRTAMLFNIEPVITIITAVIVLHETLNQPQIIGSIFVLSAVVISCYRPVRVAAP